MDKCPERWQHADMVPNRLGRAAVSQQQVTPAETGGMWPGEQVQGSEGEGAKSHLFWELRAVLHGTGDEGAAEGNTGEIGRSSP